MNLHVLVSAGFSKNVKSEVTVFLGHVDASLFTAKEQVLPQHKGEMSPVSTI